MSRDSCVLVFFGVGGVLVMIGGGVGFFGYMFKLLDLWFRFLFSLMCWVIFSGCGFGIF